jgi:hypothetical protein
MQSCKNCGQSVIYIPTSHNEVVCCNEAEKTMYTKFGRKVKGHEIHICKGQSNENVK